MLMTSGGRLKAFCEEHSKKSKVVNAAVEDAMDAGLLRMPMVGEEGDAEYDDDEGMLVGEDDAEDFDEEGF